MKRVLCLLEKGFEEIEAIAPVDLLRRAGIEVVIAGVSSMAVIGKCGVRVTADALLGDVSGDHFDALLLPGGPAVMKLRNNEEVVALIRAFHGAGKPIAAICAAPLLLGDAGILKGGRITAHFSTAGELPGISGGRVEHEANLLTSRGAGTAIDFGLAFVAMLVGEDAAAEVSQAIMA
jgi:4-methyl-5(b-hydroxyethyl)-thiazole monophosphate biosynthesis